MRLPLIFKQTMIRANAIIIVKALGAIGKVFLIRFVGAEGMGLYQLAYSFFGLMLMIISGGLPTALAMFTVNHIFGGWKLFKVFSVFLMIIGAVCSVLTFWLSSPIAQLLGYRQLDFAIRCLSPAIFVVPLLSLLRGYLQGLEKYGKIALSEIIEQTVRIGSLVLLVPLFLQTGIQFAVGGAVLGTFTGALISFVLLTAVFMYTKSSIPSPNSSEAGDSLYIVVKASLAITLTRLLIPASDFVDALIIPHRLQTSGMTSKEAAEMFGIVTGISLVIAYFPTLITGALTHTLTMKIISDWQNKKYTQFYKRGYASLELAWVWGVASGFFIFQYASEISKFIFGMNDAEVSIKSLAILPLLVGLREITTSILWAQNRKKTPFTGIGAGVLVSSVILYFLVALPDFGYAGISIGIIALELIATGWNFKALNLFQYAKSYMTVLLIDILVFEAIIIICTLCSKATYQLNWPAPVNSFVELLQYGCLCVLYLRVRFKRLFV